MKTNSLKITLVALAVMAMGSANAGFDSETLLSWMPKANDLTQLPRCSKQQRSMDFVRNTVACSMFANGIISENNNLTRVGIGALGSFVGAVALQAAYEARAGDASEDAAEAKQRAHKASMSSSSSSGDGTPTPTPDTELGKMTAVICWTLYFAGQNVPQIIDFAKDSTYRKNIIKAVWDTLFANRNRSEWAAIFVRNFGPLFMHYTPVGQELSYALPELPTLKAGSAKVA